MRPAEPSPFPAAAAAPIVIARISWPPLDSPKGGRLYARVATFESDPFSRARRRCAAKMRRLTPWAPVRANGARRSSSTRCQFRPLADRRASPLSTPWAAQGEPEFSWCDLQVMCPRGLDERSDPEATYRSPKFVRLGYEAPVRLPHRAERPLDCGAE